MGEMNILRDLAIVMLAAGLAALVFEWLRQPKILGYLLAGVLIGPHALSLVDNSATIHTLADIGVMFLMFSLGLDFNLRKMRRMGATAFVIAGLDVTIMLWIGYEIGRLLGLGGIESAFLGAILCDSSTTILSKVLKDMHKMQEGFAHILFGATIVEDILAIALIAMLTGAADGGALLSGAVLVRMGRLIIFMIVLVVAGLLVVPRLLVHVAGFYNEELLALVVAALCFGVSLLAVELKFSLALGAFMIGAITAESRLIGRIELMMSPFRHLFGAAFFMAAGLLVDPGLLARQGLLIAGLSLVVMVAKTVNCSFGALATGHDARSSFKVGLGMAQVCEFAFIIATLGLSMGAVSPATYQVAVGVALVTMVANPFLLRRADALADWLSAAVPAPVRGSMDLYLEGVHRMRARYTDNAVRRTVRRSVWVIVVNLAFVGAIFLAAGFVARHMPGCMPACPAWLGGRRSIFWAAAVMVSLPFYVATIRKTQALGMIFAELVAPAPSAQPLRGFIGGLVWFAGIAGLALVTLLLSSALLPSRNVVLGVTVLACAAMWFGWKRLTEIYARAQGALRDTFARELPPAKPSATPAMIHALMDEDLDAMELGATAPAVGRSMRELNLRTETGAAIVSIKRQGRTMVNVDAGLKLEAGDRILLLGSRDQTEAARKLLTGL